MLMRICHDIASRFSAALTSGLLLSFLLVFPANAQGIGDAFKGFRNNSTDPIQIEAGSFELQDKNRVGIFRGSVDVRQAKTRLRTAELRVYYAGDLTGGQSDSASKIERLEAKGKVRVDAEGATATGDRAWVNLKTNEAELIGNVVLSQDGNVAKGDRLIVDLKAGTSRLVAGKKTGQAKKDGGRIRILLQSPSSAKTLNKQ
ncbi:LptA/OstA family protein [Coralliovum pocilloporae]|uniref:LptA/OstA family protein n=1 Tax=Coralliovum pocilloporae TaxID=3066369 RepID=UPI0033071B41